MRITRRELVILPSMWSILQLGGCLKQNGDDLNGEGRTNRNPVYLLVAGSLLTAIERGMKNKIEIPLRVEAHGSVAIAQLVKDGLKNPDVISVSDPILFERLIEPKWHVEFAANQMVVAYNKNTDGGKLVAKGGEEKWYEPILRNNIKIGRTDPNLDPLGYRTLFLLELAELYYEKINLKEEILSKSWIFPEIELMSYFEIGGIDAAIVYKNMAVERGYDYIELPLEINLSSPEKVNDWYSKVGYKLKSGEIVRGDVIKYGSTIWSENFDAAIVNVFEEHIKGNYLQEFGFYIPEAYPKIVGDVPDRIEGVLHR